MFTALAMAAATTVVGGFSADDLKVLTYLVTNANQHCTLEATDYCQITILGKPILAKLKATEDELARQEALAAKAKPTPLTPPNPAKPK